MITGKHVLILAVSIATGYTAKAAAEAERIAAEKAAIEQMYANIARQTELLEKLANK